VYNNKLFQRYAPIYDLLWLPLFHLRHVVANQLALPKNSKVIDVACGTGSQAIVLAKSGIHVVGIDLAPAMINKAQKKIKDGLTVYFICHDATNIPYPQQFFDASVLSFGLHDMPEEIGIAIVKEMRRITKPNGKIIIVDYNAHSPRNLISRVSCRAAQIWESKYYDGFLRKGISYYLEKAGLKMYSAKTMYRGIIQMISCFNTTKCDWTK
jgi:ubiquinone/menaquinone biosynthesis C-methylase UbiE